MAKANLKVVSDEPVQTDENLRFAHLPISELRASEDNRKVGDVSDLVASIKEIGVIQPITVTPIEGGYQIVFGHRRVEAAKKAGLREIPAIVREVSERERLEQSLIENLQREDLTPYEEALAYMNDCSSSQTARLSASLQRSSQEANRTSRRDCSCSSSPNPLSRNLIPAESRRRAHVAGSQSNQPGGHSYEL